MSLVPMLALVFACSTWEESFTVTEPVDRVVIQMSSGQLDVIGSDDSAVFVEWEGSGPSSSPATHRLSDRLLLLDATCDGSCGSDVYVSVPRSTEVLATVGFGDVFVDGLEGRLAVQMSAGEMDISGSMSSVAIALEAGELDMELSSVRSLAVQMSAGQMDIEVPSGSYVLELNTGPGVDLDVDDLVSDPAADARLRLALEAGELDLKGS